MVSLDIMYISLKEILKMIKTHLNQNKYEKEYKTQLSKILETTVNQIVFNLLVIACCTNKKMEY